MVEQWIAGDNGVRKKPIKIATAKAKHENMILDLYGLVPINLENPLIRKELGAGPLINEYFNILEQKLIPEAWYGMMFIRDYMAHLNEAIKRSSVVHDIRSNHQCPGYVFLSHEAVENPIALRHIVSKVIISHCLDQGFGEIDGGGGVHILGELYPMADRMREIKEDAKSRKA